SRVGRSHRRHHRGRDRSHSGQTWHIQYVAVRADAKPHGGAASQGRTTRTGADTMTDRSPSELEREAEQVRAEISETTRQLRDKMSPGQLMDEALGYFKEGDAQRFLTNLKDQVRDNPLALALIGGGVAWLMSGSGTTHSRPAHTMATSLHAGSARNYAESGGDDGSEDDASSLASSVGSGLASAGD